MSSTAGGGLLMGADRDRYRRDGYVVVRGVFRQDRMRAWAAECDRLWSTSGLLDPDNLRTHVLASDREPDRLDPVIDLSPGLGEASRGVVRRLAATLLGDDATLFKDKLIFKPPGARGYRTHQDYAYWQWMPAGPNALVTAMVGIDGGNGDNGAVEFCAGFHDRLLTPEGSPGDVDDVGIDTPGEVIETEPGDVVVFHSLTPHRSGDNRSDTMRRQLYLSYSAAAHGDLYDRYYAGLHESLRAAMSSDARERSFFR